jgi:nitrogen fixation/metabolism regulation signal transduction histidine kinase
MRKYYYLKPNIQYAFTSFYTMLTAIEIIAFGLVLYVVEGLNLHHSYDILLYIRFSIVLLVILIFTGFNFWYGMRLSHRIVGPMIQILRVLESATKGEYKSRIQLRTNDYLHEISDELNVLLKKLEEEQKGQKKSITPKSK